MSDANKLWLVAIGVLLIITYFADQRYPVLRDVAVKGETHTNRSFSLGRVQMVFWTVLLISALVKLAALKGWTTSVLEFDHKILVLLGISGATGVLAASVDVKKDKDVEAAEAKADASSQAIDDIKKAVAGVAPGDADAIVALNTDIAAKRVELKQAESVAVRAKRSGKSSGSFFKDLLEDDNGNSLHRLQMILFTLLAGLLFAIGTINIPDPAAIPAPDAKLVTLPVIPEQILELLGIASGVYVGFKIPGKSS